jgi:hypothetical protein
MQPVQLVAQNAKLSAYKRLARKIFPVSLAMLGDVALADKQGRNPARGRPLTTPLAEIDLFIRNAQEAQVLMHPERPLLQGRDLLPFIKPGPHLGVALKRAYEIQMQEGITDKEELKKRILHLLRAYP